MLETYDFTVCSLMDSARAISRLDRPRASVASTSRSRADSIFSGSSSASSRSRLTSWAVTPGSRMLPPVAAARTASVTRSIAALFGR
jgi:hypothetical protein